MDEMMAGCKQSSDTDKCESLEFNRKASGCISSEDPLYAQLYQDIYSYK